MMVPVLPHDQPRYVDHARLVSALRSCLVIYVLAAIAWCWSASLQIDLLFDVIEGALVTEEDVEANYQRQQLVAIIHATAFLLTAVLFLRWTYVSNKNVRALCAEPMKHSPAWSVGWYFVPIINLWKPYLALKETFLASNPSYSDGWKTAPAPAMLRIWWALWILLGVLNLISSRSTSRAETADELLRATWFNLASAGIAVVLGVVVFLLVGRLYRQQHSKHVRNSYVDAV